MMAVGYGDVYPRSTEAMVFAIIVQVIGAICFGFIIGAVSDSIESSGREAKARCATISVRTRVCVLSAYVYTCRCRMRVMFCNLHQYTMP